MKRERGAQPTGFLKQQTPDSHENSKFPNCKGESPELNKIVQSWSGEVCACLPLYCKAGRYAQKANHRSDLGKRRVGKVSCAHRFEVPRAGVLSHILLDRGLGVFYKHAQIIILRIDMYGRNSRKHIYLYIYSGRSGPSPL